MISAVVLAAGASRRLGQPKQLLPVDGRPMLAHVVEAVLAAGLDEVIVVLGHQADAVRQAIADLPVRVVVNTHWAEGMASSLRAGLAAVSPQAEAVLFAPGDMPRLSPTAVRLIIERYRASGKTIVVPMYQGQRGNPVLFARSLFPQLMTLRGDRGGRALFADHPDDIEVANVGDAGVLLDIDTPEEYRRLTT